MKNLLYVFLIAMLPIIELRGAVPAGALLGNNIFLNAFAAILGNLLPIPFILLFIPKILDLMERVRFLAPIVRWVRRKADKHKGKILKDTAPTEAVAGAPAAEPLEMTATEATDAEVAATEPAKARRGAAAAFWGLMLFVLIPLPGTGAWTGSLIAALFDMPMKRSLLAVALGVLGCAVIMSLASYGVVSFLEIFL